MKRLWYWTLRKLFRPKPKRIHEGYIPGTTIDLTKKQNGNSYIRRMRGQK